MTQATTRPAGVRAESTGVEGSDDRSPLSTPEAWDGVADGYTEELLPTFERYAADALDLVGVGPGTRVVDVAAGPGTLSVLAARRGAKVSAIDFSPSMTAILRARASAEPSLRIDVTEGDGQSLPFEDGAFDAAFSMFGLMFFPDRQRGFAELARVLRPNAVGAVSAWSPLDRVPFLAALFGAIRDLLPDLPFGGDRAPLSSADDFHREMGDAGFDGVKVHELTHLVDVASVRQFWEVQVRSSAPIALLRRTLDADRWEMLAEGIVPRLEREFGAGPLQIGWPALLGLGWKR